MFLARHVYRRLRPGQQAGGDSARDQWKVIVAGHGPGYRRCCWPAPPPPPWASAGWCTWERRTGGACWPMASARRRPWGGIAGITSPATATARLSSGRPVPADLVVPLLLIYKVVVVYC
uniref:Uncharacterized protein n=1 Tax=Triticum urartu TaxID=4572 RepID=A0A8R7NY36_TRIUA